jgi:hypothetical protein
MDEKEGNDLKLTSGRWDVVDEHHVKAPPGGSMEMIARRASSERTNPCTELMLCWGRAGEAPAYELTKWVPTTASSEGIGAEVQITKPVSQLGDQVQQPCELVHWRRDGAADCTYAACALSASPTASGETPATFFSDLELC